MALLKFNYGVAANLKDLTKAPIKDGNVYITTDSQEMKVDLGGKRLTISDFIIVKNQAALEALGNYHENLFYYVEGDNLLKKYIANPAEGTSNWVNINDTSALENDLAALGQRVLTAEGNITTLQGDVEELGEAIEAINASTVDTTQNIVITTPVGNYAKGDTIDANTDLQTLILNMLSQDSNPKATQPSISLTLTSAGAKEVGSTFTPSYTLNVDAGKYEANGVVQESGVTFSNYNVYEVNRPDDVEEGTKTTQSGSFTSFTVIDGTNYEVKGTCDSSQGAMPKTFLGKDYADVRIAARTPFAEVDSTNVTGYRAWFCGYKNGTNALADATAITGDQIRGLGNSANGNWKNVTASNGKTGSMDVAQMQQMFFAAPAGKGFKPKVADSKTGAPQTVEGPITVYVKGANNYVAPGDETTNGGMAYDVWYVANASAASGSATLNITKA